jgi:hypothetical protein
VNAERCALCKTKRRATQLELGRVRSRCSLKTWVWPPKDQEPFSSRVCGVVWCWRVLLCSTRLETVDMLRGLRVGGIFRALSAVSANIKARSCTTKILLLHTAPSASASMCVSHRLLNSSGSSSTHLSLSRSPSLFSHSFSQKAQRQRTGKQFEATKDKNAHATRIGNVCVCVCVCVCVSVCVK